MARPAEQSPEPTTEKIEVTPVEAPVKRVWIDDVRDNRMGGLTAGLVVAAVLAPLLAVLVPDTQALLGLGLLGTALAVAVGFAVRFFSGSHDLTTQVAAFVVTVLGVHIVGTTGSIHTKLADLGALTELLGSAGLGFDDALLASLSTPALSTGGVITGLIAAIIAGWGKRA